MLKKFYFIRHGETDQNRSFHKVDHPDISLNDMGRQQALDLASQIQSLPIQTVYCSPLRRAQETKELFSLKKTSKDVDGLGECTAKIWSEMLSLGCYAMEQGSENLRAFFEKVQKGLDTILKEASPSLMISHGGVHWATCCLLNVQEHDLSDWQLPACLL